MANDAVNRRLAAIVSADVAGYSRLMGADEESTLSALKSHRRELIDPKIAEFNGRLVKTTGDGALIEFGSVVDAMRCCLKIQKGMAIRNESVPQERRIQFRIGVNLGDIIIDGDDIFGDGVNIAARLEAMSAPGGICLSSAVLEQVKQKMTLEVEDLGERALKNIDTPVHAFRVIQATNGEVYDAGPEAASDSVGVGFELPERPSIAIFPFRNLSSDAENDFIADGISLGIQTLLVQLSGIFLVNACSDQDYREGRKTAAEVAQGLPVRYALEGTAQRSGDRARVTVQLTDLNDGRVIWANRYDHELEDIFALQDDVTREVISSLHIELHRSDLNRVLTRDLAGDEAWEYFLRGISFVYKFNPQDNLQAREMFEKLYALRPNCVQGPGYIALTYWIEAQRGWTHAPADALAKAAEWASIAIEYENNDGLAHIILSDVSMREGRHDEALKLCEEGNEYRTNCPAMLGQMSAVQLYCGDAGSAVKSARKALSVGTFYPPAVINLLANAYRDCGDIDMSIRAAREASRIVPEETDILATLCCDYMFAGNEGEARRTAAKIRKINPEFRLTDFAEKHPYKDRSRLINLVETLRSAGLPH